MRILLVDDHPLFIEGLKNLLDSRGIQVVGIARDGFEALEQVRACSPDLVLMDVHMPRCDGVAATRLIKAERPDTQIVMLTMSTDDQDLFAAVKSGASGYLLKTLNTDEFFTLLSGLARGELPFSPGLASRILHEFAELAAQRAGNDAAPVAQPVLSARQREVLTLVAAGLAYKEVGARLGLAERTIKYHMGEIVAQLHLENRAEVLDYARRTGLVKT